MQAEDKNNKLDQAELDKKELDKQARDGQELDKVELDKKELARQEKNMDIESPTSLQDILEAVQKVEEEEAEAIREKRLNGIILAGGLSSRMGRDKGLLLIDGKTMVERAYEKLAPVCKDIILVTNKPENYQVIANRLGMSVITDIIKQRGPLSGIHAGLTHSKAGYNFVLACDLPHADPAAFIRHSQTAMDQGEYIMVAQAQDGKYHSLHGIYHQQCLDIVDKQIRKDYLRIQGLYKLIEPHVFPESDFAEGIFDNMNTPADYDRALRKQHKNL